MEIREKLVELLWEAWSYAEEVCGCTACSDCPAGPKYARCMTVLAADHLIANGVTVQEWTSVEDRLPQEDGSYLVTINYFGKHQGINIRCFAKDGETVNKYDLAGQKYVWYFYDSEYGYVSTDSVTHWMPLPTPPKGE